MTWRVLRHLSTALAVTALMLFATSCSDDDGDGPNEPTVSWSEMTSGTTVSLPAIWGSSGSNVFAVGDNGTILHYDGTAWSAMTSGSTTSWGRKPSRKLVAENGRRV